MRERLAAADSSRKGAIPRSDAGYGWCKKLRFESRYLTSGQAQKRTGMVLWRSIPSYGIGFLVGGALSQLIVTPGLPPEVPVLMPVRQNWENRRKAGIVSLRGGMGEDQMVFAHSRL